MNDCNIIEKLFRFKELRVVDIKSEGGEKFVIMVKPYQKECPRRTAAADVRL